MNTNAHNFPKIYDEISGNYRQSESISQRKNVIKDRFKHFLETEKPKSLLDLGCGAGVFAIIAKQAGVKTVVGVDISSAQIRAAKIEAVSLGLDIEYFNGVKLKCDFLVDDKIVATDYKFYWTAQTWRNILEDTGFSDITWEELDEHSTNIIFIAKKT